MPSKFPRPINVFDIREGDLIRVTYERGDLVETRTGVAHESPNPGSWRTVNGYMITPSPDTTPWYELMSRKETPLPTTPGTVIFVRSIRVDYDGTLEINKLSMLDSDGDWLIPTTDEGDHYFDTNSIVDWYPVNITPEK